MRKLQLLILAAAILAGVIWWAFYRTHHTSSRGVAALLPKETLALAHIPDFNRSREQWHRTDLYQLWREPAVQDFLAKPRAKVPTEGRIGQTVEDISTLKLKDGFFAVVSIESSAWGWVGGFRATGDSEKAAKTVEEWKATVLGSDASAQVEKTDYQGHQIRNETAGVIKLATTWAAPWFFFANDVEHLKAVLDRADGRVKDATTALSLDETFLAASKKMPGSYSAMLFARPAQIIEKFSASETTAPGPSDSSIALHQVASFCAATAFDGGRIRDTVFVGMPKVTGLENLSRASLPIATKDTFLYAASVVDLQSSITPGLQNVGFGWLGGVKGVFDLLAANGITLEEWKAAFSSEVGVIGSWSSNAQWPSLVAAIAVTDSAKANQLVTTVTNNPIGNTRWTHRENEGVHYYSTGSGLPLFSISPTIGLSDRMVVVGADSGSVEAAIKHGAGGPSELAVSRGFQNAERGIPNAPQAFVYVDPALFYARFDATLRPLLAMGAAFLPAMADTVDISKLPSADVVAKHLGPTVMSQSYQADGYLAESIGSVPLYQTLIFAVGASVAATIVYRQQTQPIAPSSPFSYPSLNAASPIPSPSPLPSRSPP